ncbi:MAG TPA: prolyl oligopeptidase family serine peptidase [Blastocatellia bacterium]|nr:prolyl oligopeptidase family serine peptidase [Blastocatellia bacterium]
MFFGNRKRILPCLIVLLLIVPVALAQQGYQKPPKVVTDILDAPPPPLVSLSPTRDRMLLLDHSRYPSIAELAEPMLRLAGLRVNPNINGPHRSGRFGASVTGLTLKNVADGKEQKLAVPAGARFGNASWSPDGKMFAIANTTPTGIELWVGDATTGKLTRLKGVQVNAVYGEPFQWMPDGRTLIVQTVDAKRGAAPVAPKVPVGPTIQESYGKQSPAATYQDLLKSAHDEALFDYYATSQLALVNANTGAITPLGKPAIYNLIDPAPDGQHILVVTQHKPYSYLQPASAFPKEVEVTDRTGKVTYKLASLPLADQVPLEGVPTGPRGYQWRPTEPATLVWVEALDGGDTKKKVPLRDRVLMLKAPFNGQPVEVAKTQHRFAGLTFGERSDVAFLRDYDRSRRWSRTFLINLDNPGQEPRVIFDLSSQDRYKDPGNPVMKTLPTGMRVMLMNGDDIFLTGNGATPEGDRPFLDRFNLKTLKAERLFHCDETHYESVVALAAGDGSKFITSRESVSEPPNYFMRSADGSAPKALTSFADPTPQVRGIKKQLVKYKRADGVDLSFTLYLPADYKDGQKLPTVLWAYPLEFSDASTAGQVSGSPNRFTTFVGYTHLFFLTQGYAILDNTTMPVVGDPETMNNTYVEQIVASAQAAIDKAVEMGVTDRHRVGVGGHSYGAFMTANLLAHSDLFRAGIARSGAYNRTLTPFGFQSERRTLWEAPEMYLKVSPFMFANKIKEPILLIHGEADNNTGTFPIQSERLYQAIKGNGGNVRYVTLPFEAHGYSSRQSTEHVLWEMINWFEKHVKEQRPVSTAGSTQ